MDGVTLYKWLAVPVLKWMPFPTPYERISIAQVRVKSGANSYETHGLRCVWYGSIKGRDDFLPIGITRYCSNLSASYLLKNCASERVL